MPHWRRTRRSFLVALLSRAAFSRQLSTGWKGGNGDGGGSGKDRRQRWGKTEEIRPVITWSTRSRRTVAFGPLFRSLFLFLSSVSVHLIFVPLPRVFSTFSFLRSLSRCYLLPNGHHGPGIYIRLLLSLSFFFSPFSFSLNPLLLSFRYPTNC